MSKTMGTRDERTANLPVIKRNEKIAFKVKCLRFQILFCPIYFNFVCCVNIFWNNLQVKRKAIMRAMETYLSFAHQRFSKNKKAINVRTSVWNWIPWRQKVRQAFEIWFTNLPDWLYSWLCNDFSYVDAGCCNQ